MLAPSISCKFFPATCIISQINFKCRFFSIHACVNFVGFRWNGHICEASFGLLLIYPYFAKDINVLEKVQNRATRLFKGFDKLPYDQRLKSLGLFAYCDMLPAWGSYWTFQDLKRLLWHQFYYFLYASYCYLH